MIINLNVHVTVIGMGCAVRQFLSTFDRCMFDDLALIRVDNHDIYMEVN